MSRVHPLQARGFVAGVPGRPWLPDRRGIVKGSVFNKFNSRTRIMPELSRLKLMGFRLLANKGGAMEAKLGEKFGVKDGHKDPGVER